MPSLAGWLLDAHAPEALHRLQKLAAMFEGDALLSADYRKVHPTLAQTLTPSHARGVQRTWTSLKVMRFSTSTQIIRATRSLASLLTAGRYGQEYLPA